MRPDTAGGPGAGGRRDPAVIGYAESDITPPESWVARRRGGVASVTCAGTALTMTAAWGIAGPNPGADEFVVMALAAAACILLLLTSGLLAGLVGVDNDRSRDLGAFGAALNFVLLLSGCLWLR